MNAHIAFVTRGARALVIVLALTFAASAIGVLSPGAFGAEPSDAPAAGLSPEPLAIPTQTLCESADDLRLIIGFLRGTTISEDGLLPTLVGTIAGLSEARELSGLVGETYGPLVDDLIASLQGLRTTIEGLDDEDTLGARVVEIGEAITDIGNAADALAVELRTPCPTDAPDASEAPTAPEAEQDS